MTPRSLVRRPLQVSGLLLATAALGTAVAPAASAMVDPSAPTDHTPAQAPVAAPRVLTNSPASYLGTPDEPVHFGEGKLQVVVLPELDPHAVDPSTSVVQRLADDAVSGMVGATVVITVTAVDEASVAEQEIGTVEGDTASCLTLDDGSCSLTSNNPALVQRGELHLAPGMAFTVQQTGAPTSGLYDLPPTGDDVFYGVVDQSRPLAFAPVSTQDRYGSAVLRFFDPARTVAGGSTAPGASVLSSGTTAAGAPAPDSTAPAAPLVPVTADASATPAAAPTLASTGADVVPMAAVGGGLLVAGAAGLVLARRRAPR